MGEVQARIDKGRDLARGCLDDDPPGRRGPHVARADRRGRIDDDGRQALGHHAAPPHARPAPCCACRRRWLRGRPWRPSRPRGRWRRLPAAWPRCWYRQCAPRRPAVAASITVTVPSTLDRTISSGSGRPEPVVGRHVEQVAHARHRARHGRRVAHIALHHLHGQPGQVGTRAGGAHQHPDLETPVQGLPHHRRAKKARRACHQNAIVNFSSPVYRSPFWAVKALNLAHCDPKARVGRSQRARQKFLGRYIVTTVSRKVMPAYQDKKNVEYSSVGRGAVPMQVILAQPRGFCAGVVRAIEIVDRALVKHGAPSTSGTRLSTTSTWWKACGRKARVSSRNWKKSPVARSPSSAPTGSPGKSWRMPGTGSCTPSTRPARSSSRYIPKGASMPPPRRRQ